MRKEKVAKDKTEKSKPKERKKPKIILWAAVGLLTLLAFGGYQYFNFKKQMNERKELVETQRQLLIDGWKEQGLTDEAIQGKLDNSRTERMPEGMEGNTRSPFGSIMRIFRGSRGGLQR